jgi:hypothetical protein
VSPAAAGSPPRNATAPVPGFGPVDERLARIAARRAFVELKAGFMNAAAELRGPAGVRLRSQLRSSEDMSQLWHLSRPLLAAMPAWRADAPSPRHDLQRQLERAFPDSGSDTGFMPL